jgi:translation initiation factor IF-3
MRFLKARDKVKVTIMFRGREMAHPERGEMILNRLAEELGDLAVVEQRPQQDGRNMTMMLAPTRQAAETGASADGGGASGGRNGGGRSGGSRRDRAAAEKAAEAAAAAEPEPAEPEATAPAAAEAAEPAEPEPEAAEPAASDEGGDGRSAAAG